MLFYIPLEAYKERYTEQWSAAKTGWLERNWLKIGLEYTRIDGAERIANRPKQIQTGCVLDAVKRSMFCFAQIEQLLALAEEGKLTSEDTIYFDDFWHPGIEALPYAFHLMGLKPQMYAFLHAQSVDEFDFTFPMRHWMRHFEQGIASVLDGIFVCGPCLRDLVVFGGIAPQYKVHITGHPFNSEEVRERMTFSPEPRLDQVVYSSRWDLEKNPWFFLEVARKVIYQRRHARFIVCTGSEKIRSNDPGLVRMIHQACEQYPDNIILKENLTKEQYYAELCRSKIQMNTADQDFVAITLLESSVAGCYPIYPYFRSFPETFKHRPGFMYNRLDVQDAVRMVIKVLDSNDLWTEAAIQSRQWIHNRFDTSWLRMLNVMGLSSTKLGDLYE